MPGSATKLRIALLRDLPPRSRPPQTAHGVFAFARKHPKEAARWMDDTNIVVVHEGSDRQLDDLVEGARRESVPYAVFHEEDLSDRLTCVVLAPSSRTTKLFKGLPLAGG